MTVNANGSLTYDPNGAFESLDDGETATDTFTYRANDGTVDSNMATVTITISGRNDAPVAVNDSYATDEDTVLTVPVAGVLTNDTDVDVEPLTVSTVQGQAANVGTQIVLPSGALVTINANGSLTYNPNGVFESLNNGETATDTFAYTASDGTVNSNTATVTITIRGVQVQTQVATTTTIATDHPAGSVYGQSVILTATVTAQVGTTVPTGSVQFVIDSSNFGSPVTLSDGIASIKVTTFDAGTYQIEAIYTSDDPAKFQGSQTAAPLPQVVTPAPLTITAYNKTKVYGAPLPMFTMSYSGYVNGDTALDLPPTVTTTATSLSPVGGYAITVSGAADPDYTITYICGTLTILKADTAAQVNSSLNPSVYGQPVTFTTTVSAVAPGAGTPTGAVTFKDGSTVLATVPLQGATASFTSDALDRGLHTITVTYAGDGNFKSTASSPITQSVQIVAMEADPLDPHLFTLAVGGTAGNDYIEASYNRRSNQLEITICGPSRFHGSYDASRVAHLALFGGRGNDTLWVDETVAIPTLLFGGDGNDWLRAGSAPSVLVGGKGNDVLDGGRGRELLIGGLGVDALWGHGGDDILIGGTTDHDADMKALDLVLAEWSRPRVDYGTRIDHLLGPTAGGTAGGLNGLYFLNRATVHDDAAVDLLMGGEGMDWFFSASGRHNDLILGRKSREVITFL